MFGWRAEKENKMGKKRKQKKVKQKLKHKVEQRKV